MLFCNGFELEFDSWEYVDIEVNVGLGDEVEYKVVMMQNGLLVEFKWMLGIL